MHRRYPFTAISVFLVTLAGILIGIAPAAQTSTVSGAATEAGSCNAGSFCVFDHADYGGFRGIIPDRPNGTCHTLAGEYRSYINARSGIEGYLYDGKSCNGSSRAVVSGSLNPNIGFDAGSFRYACVSC